MYDRSEPVWTLFRNSGARPLVTLFQEYMFVCVCARETLRDGKQKQNKERSQGRVVDAAVADGSGRMSSGPEGGGGESGRYRTNRHWAHQTRVMAEPAAHPAANVCSAKWTLSETRVYKEREGRERGPQQTLAKHITGVLVGHSLHNPLPRQSSLDATYRANDLAHCPCN